MPGRDGTGPLGTGPRTGWGAGYSAGYAIPGCRNLGWGRGFSCRGGYFGCGNGAGTGKGFGWQDWYNSTGEPFWARTGQPARSRQQGQAPLYGSSPVNKETEIEYLKHEASALENELTLIEERLENLTQNQ
jgi:hypothetical protein